MIDIKKKYKTRSGLDVRLVSDQGHPDWPIVGYVDNCREPVCWDSEGLYIGTSEPDDFDLVEVKEKKVMYVNVYSDDNCCYMHESKEKADLEKDYQRIRVSCIRVEYEEGQFDE